MKNLEAAAKNSSPEKGGKRGEARDKIVSLAALRLAKGEIIGEIVTGKEQYVTEYFQNQIKHKRMLVEKDGEIKETAENLAQELEKLYDEIADMDPSVENLLAYYKKRKERETK